MLTALGADATESERLHLIADAKCLALPEEMTRRFPKHADLAKELLGSDPGDRPTASAVLRRWPRINLRRGGFGECGDVSKAGAGQQGRGVTRLEGMFGGGRGRAEMGATVAAAAAGAAAAAAAYGSLDGSRADVISAAEAAAVTAALDVFSLKRSQSLPESELMAIVDAVAAATHAAATVAGARDNSKSRLSHGSGGGGKRPARHGLDTLQQQLPHISENASPEEVSGEIDLDTASRTDLAAEVRRLQERLMVLEGQTRLEG